MRYEDASGTFQASGPIANDDSDTLTAGARGPATGNLITGEGTQYASAGADSAAGAHVTAIAGKGGEDSSFAGGKLSVSGEFGQLSVDAEGNYSYLANTGAPENVRDRFVYTLADSQGNSDTAALVVEIGKTPVVVKADAQQIVPGPDGVVTLPPGVELSDIMVVGRNLVVNLPDGTQLVIVDGAVFVPQLVLGGVEVPATNVAALLIGQEVQPAAGETLPSSGGNFALPPPPLDPGIPLGDLIPPTEYNYIPPEPQEVLETIDRDPEITIQPDGQPAAVNAVDEVDEAGLPERNEGEPEGSGEEAAAGDNGDPSEATGGTIIIDSPDGVDSLTITGADGIPREIVVGLVVEGEFGTLRITGTVGDNFTYTYVLNDNTSGDDTQDDFEVVLTDEDGDTATATLTIDIIDDVPTAHDDVGNQTEEDAPITVDVFANDVEGADGVDIDNDPAARVELVDGTLTGEGSLVYNNDGTFTYTPVAGEEGVVTFDYRIIDGDGDPSVATVTINLQDDSEPQVGTPENLIVDEDGLAGANVDSAPLQADPGETDSTESSTDTGNVVVHFGNDVPGAPLADSIELLDSPALDGQLVDLDGNPVTFALNGSGQLVGTANGVQVMIISISGAVAGPGASEVTYSYQAQLLQPVQHADAGNNENSDLLSGVEFQVTDSDGDTDTGSFNVTVVDDVPSAGDIEVNQEAEDAPVLVDISGNIVPGADGVDLADVTFSAHTGSGALSYNDAGVFTYNPAAGEEGDVTFTYTVVDGDGDEVTAEVTIHLADDSTPQVGQPENLIVDEDGLAGANVDSAPLQADPGETDSTESATDTGNVVVNFGDDVPADLPGSIDLLDSPGLDGQLVDLDGNPVTFALNGSGQLVGTANGVQVMIISISGAVAGPGAGEVTYSYQAQLLQPVQHADAGNNENTDLLSGVQFQVTDSDGDPATGSFNVTVVDDVPSAEDIEANQVGEDSNVVVSIISSITAGADGVDLADVTFSAHSGSGTLSYNDAGIFTYNPADGEEGDVSFTYTVVDGDGDEITKEITIHLGDDSVPQIGTPENLEVDEDGFAFANDDEGQVNPTETDHGENLTDSGNVVVDFGNDVPGAPLTDSIELLDSGALDGQLVDLDGNPVTFALNGSGQLVGTANGVQVMIISISGAVAGPGAGEVTYTYSAQLLQPVQHADVGNTENSDLLSGVQFQVTDSDGDSDTGSFNVTVWDDVPSAEDIEANQVGEDANVVVSIFSSITEGADGVDLADVTFSDHDGAGSLSYNSATGEFTYDPAAGEEGDVSFTYTIVDGDGDEITKEITIHLGDDSTPDVGTPENLEVDEDGFAFANDDEGQVNPTETDHGENLTDNGNVVVDFGDDIPDAPLTDSIVLVDSGALDGQLVDLDGNPVTFALNGSGQLVGTANGVQVMIISVTAAVAGPGAGEVTYTYSAQLLQPVQHADVGNTENSDLLSGVGFQVTDSDGDTDTGSFNVTVWDDVPSAEDIEANQAGEDANVVVSIVSSITEGADGVDLADVTFSDHDGAGSLSYDSATGEFTYDPAAGEEGDVSFTYTIVDGDGDEITKSITIHLGDDSTPDVGTPQNVTVDEDGLTGANVDSAPLQTDPGETNSTENDTGTGQVVVDFGDDVPDAPLTDSIVLVDSGALDGQLVDLDGNPVTFALNGSGQLVGTANGVQVMIISVTAAVAGPGAGEVTYTYQAELLQPIQHADSGNNENTDLLSGVQFQVTDSDGDTDTGSFNVTVVDDVPSATVDAGVTVPTLTLDESPAGEDEGGDSAPAGDNSVTAGFASNFETAEYGADGAGTTEYSLELSAPGEGSGLFALDQADITAGDSDGIGQGAEILLFANPDGSVSGRLTALGPAYFTISVDASGQVTFTQHLNVWHANTGSDDDTSSLSADAETLQLVQSVTDADGDTATAAIDLSDGVFHIEDDGPAFTAPPAGVAVENGDTDPVNANLNLDIGTDGFGLLFFSSAHHNQPAEDADGNPLSFNGEALHYEVNGNVLTLETADGDVAATITLNQNGTYTFQLNGTISNGSETSFTNLTSAAAGNTEFRLLGANSAVNNESNTDIIFSGRSSDGTTGTINTNADAVGVDNQSTNSGEFVRIDFVSNLETVVGPGDPANGPQGFHHSGHVETTHFEQLIHQSSGSDDTTVDIRVFAMTADEDHVYDNNPLDGVEAGESIEEITSVTITFAQGEVHTFDPDDPSSLSFAHDNAKPGSPDVTTTVVFNGDGSITILNIQEGDVYEIDSVDTFNSVIVTNIEAPEPAGDSLDLGIFSIGSISTGDPIVQDFDIIAQDRDGDQEESTITTTINPPADTLAATSFMAQEEQLQKSAANSNTLTMAAAVAAAGMAESAAASPPVDDQLFQVESESSVSNQQFDMQLVDGGDEGGSSISGFAETFEADAAPGKSASRGRGDEHRSDNSIDAESTQQSPDDNSSHQAANDQGPAASQAAVSNAVAPDVAMVSAEMLIAAGLTGETAKQNMVEEILVDALGQGGAPTVDGLLAQLPGGLGELAALSNAASPAAGGVPGWDMAMHGGSGFAAEVLTKLDAAMLQHHDAVQPVING